MSDPTAVHIAVERLSGRLRSLPQRRLQAGAAAHGFALARWLARQAQLLEFPAREPYELPDDGIFAIGDQLAVTGHELANAAAQDPERAEPVVREALERLAATAKAVG
jgi:hypothetical protein